METIKLSGHVITGVGEGASFTQLSWAKEQFIKKLGIDPFPGTLNLILDNPVDLARWTQLKTQLNCLLRASDPNWCNARCYSVSIANQIPGAIVFPEVPGYPESQIEIIAALPLREVLSLRDGDHLFLEVSQPLSVQAVIFDVDGTLVDSVEAYRKVAELAVAPYGIQVTSEIVRRSLNTTKPGFWELVLPEDLPNRSEIMQEVRSAAVKQWPYVLSKHGRVFPGVREVLEDLRNQGFSLGIMTGSHGVSLQPLREEGLLEFFDNIVTADDIKERKPDPEGVLKVISALKFESNESVYIGDTIIDVQTSRAAGMASVSVLTGAGDCHMLSKEGPDRLIYSLSNLPSILRS